jgi:hypothetical protein
MLTWSLKRIPSIAHLYDSYGHSRGAHDDGDAGPQARSIATLKRTGKSLDEIGIQVDNLLTRMD